MNSGADLDDCKPRQNSAAGFGIGPNFAAAQLASR